MISTRKKVIHEFREIIFFSEQIYGALEKTNGYWNQTINVYGLFTKLNL